MSLSSLDHCSIRTVKLRETREFYVNILGMVDGDRADFPFPGARFSTYACRALTTAFNRFGRKQLKHRDNVPFEFDPDREPTFKFEEEDFLSSEYIAAIQDAVRSKEAQLTDVEQDVLRYRFGLSAGQNPPKFTLEKAGKMLGISKERVRQVQLRALRKIREVVEDQLPLDTELMAS